MMFFALAAAQTLAFSCTVDPPRNVVIHGNTTSSNLLQLPGTASQWKFDVSLHDSDQGIEVSLDWPQDPITAGKAVTGIAEGPHDYAFLSIHPGPCLFTVTSCLTLYTLSQQADGSAEILIQPSALGTDGDRSKPFQAFMTGHCTAKATAK